MTREEITKRIEQVEHSDFMLKMKDFWNHKDWNQHFRYQAELSILKDQLQEVGE